MGNELKTTDRTTNIHLKIDTRCFKTKQIYMSSIDVVQIHFND